MNRIVSHTLACILLIFSLALAAAWTKLVFFGVTPSSDSIEYVQTARTLCGDEGANAAPKRLLKPLAPLLVCGLHVLGLEYEDALLWQSVALYFAFSAVMFFFAREFLEDEHLALLVTLMAALSYPILKYGVDIYTETGAMLFVMIALLLTLRFARRPSFPLFIVSALVVSIGFLWKEYSIVAGLTLAAVTLFHSGISLADKLKYSVLGVSIFALIFAPVHFLVEAHYGYTYLTAYVRNASTGFSSEFTLKNVLKSTAAVLGLAWLLIPFGVRRWKLLQVWQQYFLKMALVPPFIGYAWGYIMSRLLFVLAPPFLLLAAEGMRAWSRRWQYAFVAVTIAANITWLFLSYQVTL